MAQRKMYEARAKKTKKSPVDKIVVCSTIAAARKIANEWAKEDEYKVIWIVEYIADSYGIFRLSSHAPFVVRNDE